MVKAWWRQQQKPIIPWIEYRYWKQIYGLACLFAHDEDRDRIYNTMLRWRDLTDESKP